MINVKDIIIDKTREEWIEYIVESRDFKELGILEPDSPAVFNTDNSLIVYSASRTNARRCFCDSILKNQSKNEEDCKHTYIVLYSNERTEEKVKENIKNFEKDLNIAKSLFQVYEYTRVTLIEEFKSCKVHKSINALTALTEIRDSWKLSLIHI